MSEDEFLSSWLRCFRRCGADVAATDNPRLLSGCCRLRPGNEVYQTKIRVQDGFVTIYIQAPYPSVDKQACLELVSYINYRLYKGHFNVDARDGEIVFKFMLPLSSFDGEDSPFYRELVMLPVAMINKFEPSFKMLSEGRGVEESFKNCRGGWE